MQDGDGSQGSKVPGGLLKAGRSWLCYSNHKLLPLPGGCFVLGLPVIFPWFLVLLCLQVVVFSFFFFFFPSSFLSSVCDIPCGGGGTSVCSFCFSFKLFLFRFVFFVLFPLVSLFHRMCTSCLPYPVRYDDMELHRSLLCLLHTIRGKIVSLL